MTTRRLLWGDLLISWAPNIGTSIDSSPPARDLPSSSAVLCAAFHVTKSFSCPFRESVSLLSFCARCDYKAEPSFGEGVVGKVAALEMITSFHSHQDFLNRRVHIFSTGIPHPDRLRPSFSSTILIYNIRNMYIPVVCHSLFFGRWILSTSLSIKVN